jgi:hypothetical protein
VTDLHQPDGLGDDEWVAINESADRLERARSSGDDPLVIGSAKDLCESVARVVINERGGANTGDDMTDLVTAAHKLLQFQPGEGLANDAETRKVAQSLKTMVFGLVEMRNRHGTGHGRAVSSGITSEHADLANAAAKLWTSWALRRLEPFIAGNVTGLVRDLDGETFHKGDLARRLMAANLARLEPHDQTRLGVAVARRSSRGTFVVAEDGVDAARPEDTAVWPPAYIEGVVMGLLFNANGYLDLGKWPAWAIRQVARLAAGLPDGPDFLKQVADRVTKASDAGLSPAERRIGPKPPEKRPQAQTLSPRAICATCGGASPRNSLQRANSTSSCRTY